MANPYRAMTDGGTAATVEIDPGHHCYIGPAMGSKDVGKAARRKILLRGLRDGTSDGNAYCGDCRGSGRRSGPCPRCKGRGFTVVNRTKR